MSLLRTDRPGLLQSREISADKPDAGRSERIPIRLYFASEDRVLKAPLRLEKKD